MPFKSERKSAVSNSFESSFSAFERLEETFKNEPDGRQDSMPALQNTKLPRRLCYYWPRGCATSLRLNDESTLGNDFSITQRVK